MAIQVKSKQVETGVIIKQYDANGTEAKPDKEIAKELSKELTQAEATLISNDNDKLRWQLIKKNEALAIIKEHFVEGRHFMQPTPNMKPFLTQDGASFLASAIGYTVTQTKENETLTDDFYLCEYRASGKWKNGSQASSYTGSANSKEEDMRKQYEELTKDGVWIKKNGKSVYDTIHNVQAKAKKRALVTLIRIDIGLSNEYGEEYEDPKANKTTQMKVYNHLYKLGLDIAPEAPKKKKNKLGVKVFTEKERLDWKKEWVRAVIFQPNILKEGYPTSDWGTKTVEEIINKIPKWIEEYQKEKEINENNNKNK